MLLTGIWTHFLLKKIDVQLYKNRANMCQGPDRARLFILRSPIKFFRVAQTIMIDVLSLGFKHQFTRQKRKI